MQARLRLPPVSETHDGAANRIKRAFEVMFRYDGVYAEAALRGRQPIVAPLAGQHRGQFPISGDACQHLCRSSACITQKAAPQQQASASSLPNAPIGSQLSTSEIDALRAAIHPCWDTDAGAKDAESLSADIEIQVNSDGTMHDPKIEKVTGGGNDFVKRAFAERALRTVLNPQCNKIPIPAGKYEQMKTLTITFVPGDIQ